MLYAGDIGEPKDSSRVLEGKGKATGRHLSLMVAAKILHARRLVWQTICGQDHFCNIAPTSCFIRSAGRTPKAGINYDREHRSPGNKVPCTALSGEAVKL